MKKTIISTNLELSKVGALVLVSAKANKNALQVVNVLTADNYIKPDLNGCNTDDERFEQCNTANVATFANVCDFFYNVNKKSSRVANYFAAFKEFGVFMPNQIKEQLFAVLRNALNNSFFECIAVSAPYLYNGDFEEFNGKTVVKYEFESVFVSTVALNQTALACNKKTIECWSKIKHLKGWRNAARGVLAQFDAVNIKNRIYSGETLKSPELEELPTVADELDNIPTNTQTNAANVG